MVSKRLTEPLFTRGDIADILNITPLTVANRERRGQYPPPHRDLNNYRVYGLNDVLHLQVLTYHRVDTRPILSKLYDKGYRDMRALGELLDSALARRNGS